MAAEAKRGCGYRKKGGIYLVSDALSAPCDRMPFKLDVCPCCGAGIKVSRGFTWIDPVKLFGEHVRCKDMFPCPMCQPGHFFGDQQCYCAGLLFVGDKFYSPDEFLIEASQLGVSRRIGALPRGFKIGETWVFLAHSKAWHDWSVDKVGDDGQFGELEPSPAIFCAFKPNAVEYIVDQSELDTWKRGLDIIADKESMGDAELHEIMSEKDYEIFYRLEWRVERGMTLVPVPDNDLDHH